MTTLTLRSWFSRLIPSDFLCPMAIVVWVVSARQADVTHLGELGLLGAIPLSAYASIVLVILSAVWVMTRPTISALRMTVHLVALVMMLHAVVPLAFPNPEYPVYKHVGVVQYIAQNGAVNGDLDIYQNWPGFFTLAAWFDNVAGVNSPLVYAAWAPVLFDLLAFLAVAFAFKALMVPTRQLWFSLLILVCIASVDQYYFSPQAFAFPLCLIVIGVALRWFLAVPKSAWVFAVYSRLGLAPEATDLQRKWAETDSKPPVRARPFLIVLLAIIFTAVVISHQLSPYVVVSAIFVLVTVGFVRPTFLLVGAAAIAYGFLISRLPYLVAHYPLITSLNPFSNLERRWAETPPVEWDLVLGTRTGSMLVVGTVLLMTIGLIRRYRQREPIGILIILIVSPGIIFVAQSYGGEAIYRAWLFALPWAALAASSAFSTVVTWGRQQIVTASAVLVAAVSLLIPTYAGPLATEVVPSGEIQAAEYLYEHGEPGTVVPLAFSAFPPNFAVNYGRFNWRSALTEDRYFQHRVLGSADISNIERLGSPSSKPVYFIISYSQVRYVNAYGLLPEGALADFEKTLAQSQDVKVFYRNSDATIYQLKGASSNLATT